MRECAENQLTLINDLLDISKFEAGKFDIRLDSFHVQDLVNSVVLALSSKVKAKKLSLEVNIDDNIPESVISDHQRIKQVLYNLLGNAIKFTYTGSINLDVWYEDGDILVFKIKDTGVGIDESKLDMIFEPFTQGDSSMKRRFEGTGLGLSICRRIIQLLGGEIRVNSKIDRGSEFIFNVQCQKETGIIENGEISLN